MNKKNNHIQFDISAAPLSKEAIQQARTRARRMNRVNAWVSVPMIFLAAYIGWTVAHAGQYGGGAAGFMLSVLCGLGAVALLWLGIAYWESYWVRAAHRLAVIEASQAGEALALVNAHPDLQEWVAAIVKDRMMVKGELEALTQYHEAAIAAAAERERQEQHERDLQLLHQIGKD